MTDFHLLTDYSDRSDVFVGGRLPDDIRETLKESKVMTNHPRLNPRESSYPQGEKGWVIRKKHLPDFEAILTNAEIPFVTGISTRKTMGLPKRVYTKKVQKTEEAVEDFEEIKEEVLTPLDSVPLKEEV